MGSLTLYIEINTVDLGDVLFDYRVVHGQNMTHKIYLH